MDDQDLAVDAVQDAVGCQEVDMLQALAWHSMRPAARSQSSHKASLGTAQTQYQLHAGTRPAADTSGSDKQSASTVTASSSPAESQRAADGTAEAAAGSELPQIAKLLHDNPSCTVAKQQKGQLGSCACKLIGLRVWLVV